MRNKWSFLRFVQVLLTLPFLTISCGDKEGIYDREGLSHPSEPTITTLSPESGAAGDVVTITGTGFGTDRSKGKVWLSATESTVFYVTDTEMEVDVPEGFSDRTESVRVLVAITATKTADFHYTGTTATLITSVTPPRFYNSTVITT